MAFIDKIGEKITSGANAVGASIKKADETVRLNSEISTNKSEIDRRMKKIGLCVKARLMDEIHDEEIIALAAEIDRFIARNEQIAAELKALKGIRKCMGCGAEITADCVYCPTCGAKNAPAPQTAYNGTESDNTANTADTANNTSDTVDTPETAPTPDTEPKNTSPVFCAMCGYRETPDAVFCSNCGSKLVKA
jgi:hypothetical protein